MVRIDGRQPNELRLLRFELDAQKHADGSCIVSLGDTRVLCAVTVEERVPRWMRGSGRGWLTAEYNMLPAATNTRSNRERVLSAGRTKEIQRLIGRSLRAAVDLDALGERTFNIDCDVLDADGGTRTAAITGAFVAVKRAIGKLAYDQSPIRFSRRRRQHRNHRRPDPRRSQLRRGLHRRRRLQHRRPRNRRAGRSPGHGRRSIVHAGATQSNGRSGASGAGRDVHRPASRSRSEVVRVQPQVTAAD